MNEPIFSILDGKNECNIGDCTCTWIWQDPFNNCMVASGFTGDYTHFNGTYGKYSSEWEKSNDQNIYFTFDSAGVPRWIGYNNNIINPPTRDVTATCPNVSSGTPNGNCIPSGLPLNGEYYKKLDIGESPPAPSAGIASFSYCPENYGWYIGTNCNCSKDEGLTPCNYCDQPPRSGNFPDEEYQMVCYS